MQFLRQSTEIDLMIGPAVDIADFIASVTDLVSADVDTFGIRHHNQEAYSNVKGVITLTHAVAGHYYITLTAGYSGVLGHLRIIVRDDSKCIPFWEDFFVIPAPMYDALFGTGATPDTFLASVLSAIAALSSGLPFSGSLTAQNVVVLNVTVQQFSEKPDIQWWCFEADGITPKAITGEVRLVISSTAGEVLVDLATNDASPQLFKGGGGSEHLVYLELDNTVITLNPGQWTYWLWEQDTDADRVLFKGVFTVAQTNIGAS